MAILSAADEQRLREMLAGMADPVRLVFFTQTIGCETCASTRQILDELVAASDKLSIEERNFVLDREQVEAYGIDKVPAIALVGEADSGIRFFGAPSGYEFMSLVDAILMVSQRKTRLSEGSRSLVASVRTPLDIQVFVTPT